LYKAELRINSKQEIPLDVVINYPDSDGKLITETVSANVVLDTYIELQPQESADVIEEDIDPQFLLENSELLIAELESMPYGYYLEYSDALSSNVDLAQSFVKPEEMETLLDEWERLGGLINSYRNSEFSIFGGANGRILSTVIIFDNSDGAEQYLLSSMEREMTRVKSPISVDRLSAPKLGEASIAFKKDMERDENIVTQYNVWTQIGNAVLITQGEGIQDNGNFSEIIDIAEFMTQTAYEVHKQLLKSDENTER